VNVIVLEETEAVTKAFGVNEAVDANEELTAVPLPFDTIAYPFIGEENIATVLFESVAYTSSGITW
jgi:hypothetical protein